MENYALAIANYFIELAHKESKDIRPLKLMKLVYIAHGYILAMLDKPTDGAKLEKVEAWQSACRPYSWRKVLYTAFRSLLSPLPARMAGGRRH